LLPKKNYLCWFFLVFIVIELSGQCLEITVDEQLKICSAEQGLLSASTNGRVLFSEWTPTKGLSNPLSLNSPITNPFDTTYTLRVKGYLETKNLLTNSDFSEGNIGFTSQYEYESTKPGGYIIGKIGTELFPDAKECEDHSTPEAGGNMLMVRVSESANLDIYCQEISVAQNQDYHFQGFATGLVLNSPPVIVLKINGEIVSIGTLGSFACSWQGVNGDWNSGQATTAKICLSVSEEDIGAGTDFVLDDISFYEVCEVEKKVEVEVVDFKVDAEERIGLICGDSLNLSAAIIPNDISFVTEWTTTDGNFLSGENSLFPKIDATGSYKLSAIATFEEQTCRAEKTVEVYTINEAALAISKTGNLHCNQNEISLTAIDTVNRAAFNYEWTSLNGASIVNPTLPTIQIDQSGVYQLERTDLAGNCTQKAEIIITETNLQGFTFEEILPSCENARGTILFDEIIGGEAPFIYSIDGGNTFFSDRIFMELDGGRYDLIVQDVNECQAEQTINFSAFIDLQLDLPNSVRIQATDNFQLPLQVNVPDSLIERIEWSPSIGLSCSDCIQPFLTSKKAQIYKVVIIDKNACQVEATINIEVIEPSDVFIPSAFSPNEDGQNDIFFVQANQESIKKVNRFNIFDRYGNLVFSQFDFLPNNAANGWNGWYKGETMPIGVYVFWMEVEMSDGEQIIFSGEVGLIR